MKWACEDELGRSTLPGKGMLLLVPRVSWEVSGLPRPGPQPPGPFSPVLMFLSLLFHPLSPALWSAGNLSTCRRVPECSVGPEGRKDYVINGGNRLVAPMKLRSRGPVPAALCDILSSGEGLWRAPGGDSQVLTQGCGSDRRIREGKEKRLIVQPRGGSPGAQSCRANQLCTCSGLRPAGG